MQCGVCRDKGVWYSHLPVPSIFDEKIRRVRPLGLLWRSYSYILMRLYKLRPIKIYRFCVFLYRVLHVEHYNVKRDHKNYYIYYSQILIVILLLAKWTKYNLERKINDKTEYKFNWYMYLTFNFQQYPFQRFVNEAPTAAWKVLFIHFWIHPPVMWQTLFNAKKIALFPPTHPIHKKQLIPIGAPDLFEITNINWSSEFYQKYGSQKVRSGHITSTN